MSHELIFAMSPAEALQQLKEGNARFVSGGAKHPHADQARVRDTAANGQHPFATIIGCSDSRVPAELLFDQGFGDLFIIRVAGNVCATDEIGSAEYGVDHLGTPLVVVLGHTKCGAVTAVTTGAQVHGSIPKLVAPIAPALASARAGHPGMGDAELVPYVIEANIWQAIEDLLRNSPDVAKHVQAGRAQIVGALYDIETGAVKFLGEHPRQAEILG
jgi:carbonic anhydrase